MEISAEIPVTRPGTYFPSAAPEGEGAGRVQNQAGPGGAKTIDQAEKGNGAVFFSPTLSYDMLAKVSVMTFRNTETGEVIRQIPSERALQNYRDRMLLPQQGAEPLEITA